MFHIRVLRLLLVSGLALGMSTFGSRVSSLPPGHQVIQICEKELPQGVSVLHMTREAVRTSDQPQKPAVPRINLIPPDISDSAWLRTGCASVAASCLSQELWPLLFWREIPPAPLLMVEFQHSDNSPQWGCGKQTLSSPLTALALFLGLTDGSLSIQLRTEVRGPF